MRLVATSHTSSSSIYGVAVDKHVSEGDDPGQVGNLLCGGRIEAAEPIECIAEDLELPLHSGAEHRVALVLLPGALGNELGQPSGLARVPEQRW